MISEKDKKLFEKLKNTFLVSIPIMSKGQEREIEFDSAKEELRKFLKARKFSTRVEEIMSMNLKNKEQQVIDEIINIYNQDNNQKVRIFHSQITSKATSEELPEELRKNITKIEVFRVSHPYRKNKE